MFASFQIALLKPITSADLSVFEINFKYICFILLLVLFICQLVHLSRYGVRKVDFLYDLVIVLLIVCTLVQLYKYGTCLAQTLKYYQSSKVHMGDHMEFKTHVSFSKCVRKQYAYHILLAILTFLIVCRFIKLLQFTKQKPFKSLNVTGVGLIVEVILTVFLAFLMVLLWYTPFSDVPHVLELLSKFGLLCCIINSIVWSKY